MEDKEKQKNKQLERNREQLIRERTPIHSKVPSELFYKNYDNIKWDSKTNKKEK